MHGLSAAHRALPLGTLVQVRHLGNGRTVTVKVNDRGPFVRGRIIDLSRGAAEALDMVIEGVAKVEIRVVRDAPDPDLGKRFMVQVGAFRDRDNALALKLRLAPTFPGAEIVSQGGLHRVYVGTFDRKRDAQAVRRKVRALGHDAVVLTRRHAAE
jgi:rare lipoprotein A